MLSVILLLLASARFFARQSARARSRRTRSPSPARRAVTALLGAIDERPLPQRGWRAIDGKRKLHDPALSRPIKAGNIAFGIFGHILEASGRASIVARKGGKVKFKLRILRPSVAA